ncbi:MAG TPA: YciI family protein [Phnomibacter sp.]|nr:YciI family protein [Phnomibacter sp.]
MKYWICQLMGMMFFMDAFAQQGVHYNAHLADSLKADNYGMRSYFLVLLKTGISTEQRKEVVDSLFRGHMQNMDTLVAKGKLIIAGPFLKNDQNLRGLFLLVADNETEARSLVSTDPAVKAQLLSADIIQWYGSAALPMYMPYHYQIMKIKP